MKLGDIHNSNPTQCTYLGGGNREDWCSEQGCKANYNQGPPARFASCVNQQSASENVLTHQSASSPIQKTYSTENSLIPTFAGFPVCQNLVNNPSQDVNGYYYGTENGKSCIIVSSKTNEVQAGSKCTTLYGFPCCKQPVTNPSIDKNGHRYGFENGRSCIIV